MVEINNKHWIIKVAIPRPLYVYFTYRIPQELFDQIDRIRMGTLLQVPFGKSSVYGFSSSIPELISDDELSAIQKDFKIKTILKIHSEILISDEITELVKWTANYYHIPLGEVFQSAIPTKTLLKKTSERKKKEKLQKELSTEYEPIEDMQLSSEQTAAVNCILEALPEKKFSPFLIEGVTGSGKTEVYAKIAKKCLNEGKSVLFLVPEISLTPQTQARIEGRLQTRTAVWHSALSEGQRSKTYLGCQSGEIQVLIGARSAVFSPLKNLGLIVIDEEHDPSYKQEERIRYHGRDVAVMRAKQLEIPVLMGSATPSFESLENVKNNRYRHIELKNRVLNSQLPTIEIIDLTQENCLPEIQIPLTDTALTALKEVVSKNEQALIFLNRRGWASFLLCSACGYVPNCPSCSISMTFHKRIRKLKCHLCGHQETPPDVCEKCQGSDWIPVGTGTESAEAEIEKLIPGIKIGRLDRDQITSHSRLEKILSEFRSGNTQVLVGTQMLVKGHDFPNVTLVIILLADSLFKWPDFRSGERAYQILNQVAGRSGRSEKPGKVLIQTYNPDHSVLKTLIHEMSLSDFRESEQEVRKLLHYPPFGRMVRIRTSNSDKNLALQNITKISEALNDKEVEKLGPNEPTIERINSEFRWDLILRSNQIQSLHRLTNLALQTAQKNEFQISIDVDPVSMG